MVVVPTTARTKRVASVVVRFRTPVGIIQRVFATGSTVGDAIDVVRQELSNTLSSSGLASGIRRPGVDICRPGIDIRRPGVDIRRPGVDIRRPEHTIGLETIPMDASEKLANQQTYVVEILRS